MGKRMNFCTSDLILRSRAGACGLSWEKLLIPILFDLKWKGILEWRNSLKAVNFWLGYSSDLSIFLRQSKRSSNLERGLRYCLWSMGAPRNFIGF